MNLTARRIRRTSWFAIWLGLVIATASAQTPQAPPAPRPSPPQPRPAPPTRPVPQPDTANRPSAPAPARATPLTAAIDQLGKLEYASRAKASATVRRAPADQAVPALITAVTAHKDGYVRFRALVLLAGFNDPRARDVMVSVLGDRNDRLRQVAYSYFEEHPDPVLGLRLLAALPKETSEFVRPSLTRALAAHAGANPQVQAALRREVMRGQDYFRSGVIEALGDHRAGYAFPELIKIAQLDGPLQDDAVLALGRTGDKRALETFVALQQKVPQERRPALAAAICLLGVNCGSHQRYLSETLAFAAREIGFQPLLRATTRGLADLAVAGQAESLQRLVEVGRPSRDPARAPIALAVGTVALRNPTLLLDVVAKTSSPAGLVDLLREAFDMLEEDYAEERFYATVRRAYWTAPAGSATKKAAETLIGALEF